MSSMRENPFQGLWKGWALKVETFLGPEMATGEASAIWAHKSQDFHSPSLPMARVMDLSTSKVQSTVKYTVKYNRAPALLSMGSDSMAKIAASTP